MICALHLADMCLLPNAVQHVLNFCLKLVTDAKEEYDNAYLFLVHMSQTYCGQLGGTAVIPNVLRRRFSASSIQFFTEKIKSDSFIYSPNAIGTTPRKDRKKKRRWAVPNKKWVTFYCYWMVRH
jgi:hypothetical protein